MNDEADGNVDASSPVTVVIGGGSLAGMACAIRLHQLGISTLVLEKDHFPRGKLCGEFLGPDAFESLRLLGVWEQVEALAWGPVESSTFYDVDGRSLTLPFAWVNREEPYGVAIPRATLDPLLLQHGQRLGIPVREGCRILSPVEQVAGGFQLNVQSAYQKASLNATVFVDATGRNGGLKASGEVGFRHAEPAQVGIQCHVNLSYALSSKNLNMFFFPGGYGGIQPIGPRQANLCLLAPASASARLKEGFASVVAATIGKNPKAQTFLQQAQPAGDFHTTAGLNLLYRNTRQSALIRIGDAMLTIDPITGSGMTLALKTGILAAEQIEQGLRAGLPYGSIRSSFYRAYHAQLDRRLRILQIFRPLLYSAPMRKVAWPFVAPALPTLARLFHTS